MAPIPPIVVHDRENDWNVHVSYIVLSYNCFSNAAAGLSSNELFIGRFPRLPMTVFKLHAFDLHQGLDHDQISYRHLARFEQWNSR